MGGHALKNVKTRRYTTAELDFVKQTIIPVLREELNCRVDAILSYTSKPDHGDLDIMIEWDLSSEDLNSKLERISQLFPWDDIHRNTNIISVNYEELQVDYMFMPSRGYDTCFHFFAYNDLGGFMGKIARSMGLRYGQQGLFFDIYNEKRDRCLKSIVVTKEPVEIFEFLGFDYYTFVRGFMAKEDIFKYITTSNYFRKATFDGSELNYSQRSRDMGRPMYQDLLAYIADKPDAIKSRPHLNDTLETIKEWFGIDLAEERYKLYQQKALEDRAKQKFNGKLIMERYNIAEGNVIGNMIETFYKQVNSILPKGWSYYEWCLQVDDTAMWQLFEQVNNIPPNGSNNSIIKGDGSASFDGH